MKRRAGLLGWWFFPELGQEPPEGEELLRGEPEELDAALVQEDGLLARAGSRPAHGGVHDPGLQEKLPLRARQSEEADGAEGEPPRVLQVGPALAQVEEGDVVLEREHPAHVPQDLHPGGAAGG